MNISLPDTLRGWLEEQAAQGNQSVDAFVQKLIEDARERVYWEWVESKVAEALDSGPATPMTPGEWDRLRRRITDRFPEATAQGEG